MPKLLTENELKNTLLEFKKVLSDFDFSKLNNIVFFNLESFFAYVDNVKNNPFEQQLEMLNKQLDILQPYLPFVSSDRASEFLCEIAKCSTEESSKQVKLTFTEKIRQDFIELTRKLSSSSQWDNILITCEEIRSHKEESALASI
ncbi:MAG: hypothetical protein BEN19_08190 [Epulopiscium sp. Nuni2H_MBin003]|nr:MAG: hypothetical protein BEN19_08190 [Epulopiscium sp. Nuni2H_MBin003]